MPHDEPVMPSSMGRVYATEWYGQPALALETAALRLITVPELGAKIVSVFDRQAEREWLQPPKDGYLQSVAYGSSFVDQDMSGWDEMFPTIDRCQYPVAGAYQGAELPDHGEVWALPWGHDANQTDVIQTHVQGRALPYTLTRTIRALHDATIRLSYEVVNTNEEPLVAFWTAHPQFIADAETRIILPDNVAEVVNVQSTNELPKVGALIDWPEARTQSGELLMIDRVRAASEHKHRKIYLPPEQPAHWAALRQGVDGPWLRLSWDAESVPYLGIWVDEGSYNPAPTAALEPSTGYYDTLALAWQNERVMHLLPGITLSWSLDLTLGHGPLA